MNIGSIALLLAPICSGAQDREARSVPEPIVQGEVLHIESEVLGEERTVRVSPAQRRVTERIVARQGRRHVVVYTRSIEWIEAAGNYLRVQTDSGDCLVRSTMISMEARLDPQRFLRIHRSALVCIECIESWRPLQHGECELRMRDGKILRSSRAYGEGVRRLKLS